MSVFKEAMHAVRTLRPQQRRIWNDACDYGIPIKSLEDQPLKEAKNLIEAYFDPSDCTREVDSYETGKTVKVKLMMVDEFGDGETFPLYVNYITFKKPMNSDHGKIIGILEINSDRW